MAIALLAIEEPIPMSSNKHSLSFYFTYDEGSDFSMCSWGKEKEAPDSRKTGMLRGPADRDGP